MAIRKQVEESLTVPGSRDEWVTRVQAAFDLAEFSRVEANERLGQISGRYRKFMTSGNLTVTVAQSNGSVSLHLRSVANVDNLYALFRSPNEVILRTFKAAL